MKNNIDINAFESLKQGKSYKLSEQYNISLIRQEDFTDIVTMLNTDSVNKYLFYAPAPSELFEMFFNPMIEEAQESMSKNEWPSSAGLVIRDNENNFIGNAGLAQAPFLEGNYEMGFHIIEAAWGKGLATLIAGFMTTLAFDHLSAYKLTADCYGGNTGSVKVLEKIGFKQEGNLVDYYKTDDKLFFGLTKSQFSVK